MQGKSDEAGRKGEKNKPDDHRNKSERKIDDSRW